MYRLYIIIRLEDGCRTQRDINVSVLWSFWDISIHRDDTRTDVFNIFTSSFPTQLFRVRSECFQYQEYTYFLTNS